MDWMFECLKWNRAASLWWVPLNSWSVSKSFWRRTCSAKVIFWCQSGLTLPSKRSPICREHLNLLDTTWFQTRTLMLSSIRPFDFDHNGTKMTWLTSVVHSSISGVSPWPWPWPWRWSLALALALWPLNVCTSRCIVTDVMLILAMSAHVNHFTYLQYFYCRQKDVEPFIGTSVLDLGPW